MGSIDFDVLVVVALAPAVVAELEVLAQEY